MNLDEVDTRLRLLDQAIDAGDYPGARVRFFGLVHGLSLLARQDGEQWHRAWQGPVHKRALPLCELLVSDLGKELRAQQRRARKATGLHDIQAFEDLMRRQQKRVSEALLGSDPEDRQISIRELARLTTDSSALACLDTARQVLEGHLKALERVKQRRFREQYEKRQRELEQLREDAGELLREQHRAFDLQERLTSSQMREERLVKRAHEAEALLDAERTGWERARAEQQRLARQLRLEREERQRHEQRLANLEERASKQRQRQDRALAEARGNWSKDRERWRERQEDSAQAQQMLRDQLSRRDRTIAHLKQRVSIRDQERQDRFDLILDLAREEERALGAGKEFPADETYGVLLAWLWCRVAEATGLAFHDMHCFEEELEELLGQPALLGSLLGHEAAVAAFNRFQDADFSPLDPIVKEAGYAEVSRDELIVAFAEHWPAWQRRLQARMHSLFLRFRSGNLPGQQRLESWLHSQGIDATVLTAEHFIVLMEEEPKLLSSLMQGPKPAMEHPPPSPRPAETDSDSPFGV